MLNVDLKKAFDSVDWEFIKDMLIALQFPSTFISWTMACISSTSYSLAYNGSMHGFFKGERGLRKGDLLSPFLFVLCLEYLSRSLRDQHSFLFYVLLPGNARSILYINFLSIHLYLLSKKKTSVHVATGFGNNLIEFMWHLEITLAGVTGLFSTTNFLRDGTKVCPPWSQPN